MADKFQNIKGKLKGNILILEIDLSKEVGETKKGNVIVAQTHGMYTVPISSKPGSPRLKLFLSKGAAEEEQSGLI
jgi:hypothetical protein